MGQGARGWRTGMTQRDGEGAGFRMGNTCTPVTDSCQCMAKPIQYCKVNKQGKKKKKKECLGLLTVFFFLLCSQEREREKLTLLFPFHCHIHSSGLAASYGSSIFSFKRHLHTGFFYSGCINLHPCQLCTWVPFCPNPSQPLSFLSFLMTAFLTGARWCLSRF